MKYSTSQTAALCLAVLLPYSFAGTWFCAFFGVNSNTILLPSLVLFFFLYLRTIKVDFPRALAVYVGVCAVQTFPVQFSYALDARLYPLSGAAESSMEAALFQLVLACLLPLLAYPFRKHFAWMIDHLEFPRIWYFIVSLSSLFLFLNIIAVPDSYSTLHAGRMHYLFPLLEGCLLIVLISIYLLFYQGARIIWEHARLEEHSQLLEMQAHRYRTLQEYMRQTARLRHDFRHDLRLLSSLAEKNDLDSIRSYLIEYEDCLAENTSVNYCANAALNALFCYYHEMAVSSNVKTDWKIELPSPLTVSEPDMAALFGNLIENAIAGCLSLPEEQRYFSLTSEIRHGNNLYIVSTNSFDGNIRRGKSGYRSTKHSGKGTGLVSIAAVAEKYHGSAQFSNQEKEFYADVVVRI